MIVGFNFNRLIAERRIQKVGRININNNIRIMNVEESDVVTQKNASALNISFEFSSNYTSDKSKEKSDVGQILITGSAVYVDDKRKILSMLKTWNKDKKLPEDIISGVLTELLTRANIEAVILSKEVNLPPPMPMPRVGPMKKGKADNSYIG